VRSRPRRATQMASALAALVLCTAAGCAPDDRPERTPRRPLPRGAIRVKRVIDGDTIMLVNGERVCLVGVDTPEIHHPELPVQRFGQEAAEFLRRMAQGKHCALEYEPPDYRDGYGRLLAYVFVEGKMLNEELIRRRYAYAYTRFPPRHADRFNELEREARQRQYGLWNCSLRDGGIARLVDRYESLSLEGRQRPGGAAEPARGGARGA
jgi:micrococcal nuclease